MLKLKLHLGPLDMKSRLIGEDPDAQKDCRREEKGATEDERVGWYHQLNGKEFEQTLGDDEGQGSRHAAVHGVTESWARLGDRTTITTFHFGKKLMQQSWEGI